MASFTTARLPGSIVRAEAKPIRSGKPARRLAPRRAIAEPSKASAKFTPAWKLQVRSHPLLVETDGTQPEASRYRGL